MNDDFAERLAAATPTPGGGAAAARAGLHGTALLRMVLSITRSRSDDDSPEAALAEARRLEGTAAELSERFSRLEEADMAAFDGYLGALRLPKRTPEEKERRAKAVREAARSITEVPLSTLESALATLELARRLLELSSTLRLRAGSDLGGAVELAHAAFRTAELNVRVNLPALGDERPGYEARFSELLSRLEAEYPSLRRGILEWLERTG